MTRLVGYRRVSTKAQEDGFGLDVQEDMLVGTAALMGATLVATFTDVDRSGGDGLEVRTELFAALALIGAGNADGLLVPRLDRLARDLIMQETLMAEVARVGGAVWSCSPSEDAFLRDDGTDPARKLIRQILGAVAEYERALLKARMSAGRARKAASGGFAGGPVPYGWRSDGHGGLEPVAVEAAAIRLAREHRGRGLSLRAVAGALEAAGVTPPRGGTRWHPGGVARILRAEAS